MSLWSGFGRIGLETSGLTQDKLIPLEPMEFSLAGESTSIKSTKRVDGKLKTDDSGISSETYTLTLGIEAMNWAMLGVAFGQLPSLTASASLPEIRYATVPTTTPFEIVDTDITSNQVMASINVDDPTKWGGAKTLERVTTGTPTEEQFKVDTSGTKMVFASALAGAGITYRVFKTYANIQTIGVESVYQAISTFSFSGIAYTGAGVPVAKIRIPKLTKTGIPTMNLSDTTKLDLTFELATVGNASLPFELYYLKTA